MVETLAIPAANAKVTSAERSPQGTPRRPSRSPGGSYKERASVLDVGEAGLHDPYSPRSISLAEVTRKA